MVVPWSPPLNATARPWSGRTYTIAHRGIRGKEHLALRVIELAGEAPASLLNGS